MKALPLIISFFVASLASAKSGIADLRDLLGLRDPNDPKNSSSECIEALDEIIISKPFYDFLYALSNADFEESCALTDERNPKIDLSLLDKIAELCTTPREMREGETEEEREAFSFENFLKAPCERDSEKNLCLIQYAFWENKITFRSTDKVIVKYLRKACAHDCRDYLVGYAIEVVTTKIYNGIPTKLVPHNLCSGPDGWKTISDDQTAESEHLSTRPIIGPKVNFSGENYKGLEEQLEQKQIEQKLHRQKLLEGLWKEDSKRKLSEGGKKKGAVALPGGNENSSDESRVAGAEDKKNLSEGGKVAGPVVDNKSIHSKNLGEGENKKGSAGDGKSSKNDEEEDKKDNKDKEDKGEEEDVDPANPPSTLDNMENLTTEENKEPPIRSPVLDNLGNEDTAPVTVDDSSSFSLAGSRYYATAITAVVFTIALPLFS